MSGELTRAQRRELEKLQTEYSITVGGIRLQKVYDDLVKMGLAITSPGNVYKIKPDINFKKTEPKKICDHCGSSNFHFFGHSHICKICEQVYPPIEIGE